MYIILFLLLFFGLLFHEILSPLSSWLLQYSIPVAVFFVVGFLAFGIYYGKTRKSILAGIGAVLATSQFWFFVFVAVLSIADMVNTETDVVLSFIVALLVGVISYAYGSFNYKMLRLAGDEDKNGFYYLAVGVIGWIVNGIILF